MVLDRRGINLLVVAITVLAVALLTWAYLGHWQAQTPVGGAMKNAAGPITLLPAGQLPPALPSDIVLASDAKILNSYMGTLPNGKAQSTVIYSSRESSNQIIGSYMQYFFKNGWTLGALKIPNVATGTRVIQFPNNIAASKSSSTISIDVVANPGATSMNLVSVTMLK